MKTPSRLLSLAGAASLYALVPSLAWAQPAPVELPPPPPSDGAALQCPSCEPGPDDRRAIDGALDLLAAGRADAARRLLQPRLTGQYPWGRSYGTLAVLDRLATRLATHPAAPVDDTNEARGSLQAVSLYASAITLGIGTGIWFDVMIQVNDVRAAVVAPLVLGGLGATALYLAERNGGPIRRGRGAAMSNGFLLGIVGGGLLGIYGGDRLRWSGRAVASTIWGGAVLGGGLGYLLGAVAESRPASASFVGSGGLWGAAFGLGVAVTVNAHVNAYPIAAMVGELVGAGTAAALTGVLRPAEAQVRWMDLGVFSGGLVGVGIAVLAFANSGSSGTGPALVVEATALGGGVLGYVLGRPSPSPAATRASQAALHRFAVAPAIAPTPGGAQVLLSLPNLL